MKCICCRFDALLEVTLSTMRVLFERTQFCWYFFKFEGLSVIFEGRHELCTQTSCLMTTCLHHITCWSLEYEMWKHFPFIFSTCCSLQMVTRSLDAENHPNTHCFYCLCMLKWSSHGCLEIIAIIYSFMLYLWLLNTLPYVAEYSTLLLKFQPDWYKFLCLHLRVSCCPSNLEL